MSVDISYHVIHGNIMEMSKLYFKFKQKQFSSSL